MNWIDLLIIGVIGISGILSLFRGFTREALSLVSWALAFVAAFVFSPQVSQHFTKWISVPELRLTAAFALIFIVVLIIGSIISAAVSNLVSTTGLGGTDRTLGVVFGLLRGALVIAGLVILAGFTKYPDSSDWKTSKLLPKFVRMADWLRSNVPHVLSDFEKGHGPK